MLSILKSTSDQSLSINSDRTPLVNSAGKLPNGEDVYGAIIYTTQPDALRASGIIPNSTLPGFVTSRITADDLVRLSNLNEVKYIHADELKYPLNDIAKGLIGADLLHSGYINNTPYKGTGVIMGLIDSGIDWEHSDFRNPNDQTKSRILYIWDQSIDPQGSEVSPSGFTYGVEYTKVQIENELDGSPANFVREEDTNGHGSHVTGSAAGNGSAQPARYYGGIAPEADLIVVKAGNGSFPTSNLIDALTYIKNKAISLGKAAVVNMSLGSSYGPHDGTDAESVAIDDFSGNGRVVCLSAGNSGDSPIHISGTIPAGGTTEVTITVPTYTPLPLKRTDDFGLDVWLSDGAATDVTVISPNGISKTQLSDGSSDNSTNDGTISLKSIIDPANNDRELDIYVYDGSASRPPVAGTWRVRFTNKAGSPSTFHGWLYNSDIGQESSVVSVSGGNTAYTVSNTAKSAIICGAYASRWRWQSLGGSYYFGTPDLSDQIASFSSIGPTRDGRMKPDIAAPGHGVFSVRSSSSPVDSASQTPDGLYILFSGTSMATPVVTGSSILLLQKDNTLPSSTVRSLITENSLKDSYTGSALPNNTWGAGKLDVFKAMTKLYNSGITSERSILQYDQWSSNLSATIANGSKAAVKFTPTVSGKISGCFFHTRDVSTLTSPLTFEVWNDNGGVPGSKIGNSIAIAQDHVAGGSWNFINLQGTNAAATLGNTFYIVMYYNSGTASFAFDNGASTQDARTFINSGSGWSVNSSDLRLRTVVTQDVSELPVELFAFSAAPKKGSVMLNWSTANEVNSFIFEIERLLMTGEKKSKWEKIGEVKASGNSNSPKEYSFEDKNISAGNYNYRLKTIDTDGTFEYSEAILAELLNPVRTELLQNYPNPFNPSTKIKYSLASNTHVKLKVYNVLGSEVATLTNEFQPAGSYTVDFDGSRFAAGVYVYKLEAGSISQTRKFVLIK